MRGAIVAAIAISLALSAAASALPPLGHSVTQRRRGPSKDDFWTSYGGDNQLTNSRRSRTLESRGLRHLRLAWSARLDGPLVASPLAARGTSEGARMELVLAATEAGSVYALSASSGHVLWKREFGVIGTAGCGSYGISSTGAIDPRARRLYVASADGLIHALDLDTGAEVPGWPVRVIDRTDIEYVWGGLRLAEGRLYVPIASYCDAPGADGVRADGRIVALDPGTASTASIFDTIPGPSNLGGVWGWGGVAVEPGTGNLFTGIGNAYAIDPSCNCVVDDTAYGDSLVELSPDLRLVLASNRPATVPRTGDDDFGAAPVLFQPDGCPPLAAANNKHGALYIWDRTQIGAGPRQTLPLSDAVTAFVGAPSYDPLTGTLVDAEVVVPSPGGNRHGLVGLRPAGACSFHPIWKTAYGEGDQSPPLLVGDVVFADGGVGGGFAAFALANGHKLWSFSTAGSQTVAPLVTVGGTVFGGDARGVLYAFRTP